MVGGGLAGALLAGLAFVLVNTLTGTTVATGLLLFPLSALDDFRRNDSSSPSTTR